MGLFGLTKKEQALWDRVKPESKISLRIYRSGEIFYSKVEKVAENFFYITTPKVGNAFLEIPLRTRVIIELEVHSQGISRLRFKTRVVDYNWAQGNTIKLDQPRCLRLLESRKYYRVEISAPAEFSFVEDKNEKTIEVGSSYYAGMVKSISEGGAMVLVDKLMPVEKGSLMNIRISLNTGFIFRARAQVAHIYPVQGKFGLGIQFVVMNGGDRDRLLECISLQRRRTTDF